MKKNLVFVLLFAVLSLVGAGCVGDRLDRGNGADPNNVERSSGPQQNAAVSRGYGLGYGNSSGRGERREISRQNCLADECLGVSDVEYPVGTLDDASRAALDAAIQDEYRALATYQATVDKLGMVRPFAMIIRAEENHINALKAIYDRYGLVPPAAAPMEPLAIGTLAEMCAIGVKAEIDNAALYRDQLLPTVQDHEDIVFVFTNLMDASQEKHLPAFQRCSGR